MRQVEGGVEMVAVFQNKVPKQLSGGLVVALSDLVSQNTGQPVKFVFQVHDQHFLV